MPFLVSSGARVQVGDDAACVVCFQGSRHHGRVSELGRPERWPFLVASHVLWNTVFIKVPLSVPQSQDSVVDEFGKCYTFTLSDIQSTYENLQASEKYRREGESC